MNKFVIIVALVIIFAFSNISCMHNNSPNKHAQDTQITSNQNGKITYGMVKKHIEIGKTSQEDVIKLFGSPDNMVMNKKKEMWIYDRFRVETSSKSSSGYGTLLLLGGSSSSSQSSAHTKTITVIIDFDEEGIVEDLNMRVGGY